MKRHGSPTPRAVLRRRACSRVVRDADVPAAVPVADHGLDLPACVCCRESRLAAPFCIELERGAVVVPTRAKEPATKTLASLAASARTLPSTAHVNDATDV